VTKPAATMAPASHLFSFIINLLSFLKDPSIQSSGRYRMTIVRPSDAELPALWHGGVHWFAVKV